MHMLEARAAVAMSCRAPITPTRPAPLHTPRNLIWPRFLVRNLAAVFSGWNAGTADGKVKIVGNAPKCRLRWWASRVGRAILRRSDGPDDTTVRNGHRVAARVGRRRRYRARTTDAARRGGAAPIGARVYGARTARPHAAGHRAGERGVSPADRGPTRPLVGPRTLSRHLGPADAARARRSCARKGVSQTRGRRHARDPGRRTRRLARGAAGPTGFGSRPGSVGGGRPSEKPGDRIAVLRGLERGGDRRRAACLARH